MLRSYLKIALRSLWRNKLFSVINVAGLALSMAVGVGLLASLKANFDTDHFHPHLDRTVRLLTDAQTPEGRGRWASSPEPLAEQVRKLSFVENVVQVRAGGSHHVLTDKGEVSINVIYTQPSFFDVFGFTLASSNGQQALSTPNNVLLSKATARRLFGDRNPQGQQVELEGLGILTVAGVVQNPPMRTHIVFDALLPLQATERLARQGNLTTTAQRWDDYKSTTLYALLREPNDITQLTSALAQFTKETAQRIRGNQLSIRFSAQLLEDVTPWDPSIRNDLHAGMNWKGIWSWVFLAVALTLLAAFNYTSLSLARGLARAREVGIRKASGAMRGQLFGQFLTESTLIAGLSLLLSVFGWYVVIDSGLLPAIHFPNGALSAIGPFIGWLLAYTLLTGVVAGAIPAWLLSRFQPTQVLRNLQNVRLLRGVGIYKFLIVIQFAVTTMLMVFFVVLYDAGENNRLEAIGQLPDHIVVIDLKGQSSATLKQQISQLSQVERVSVAGVLPMLGGFGQCKLKPTKTEVTHSVSFAAIDPSFVPMFGFKLRAGTNFPANLPQNHEQYVLLNESAARLLPGLTPESAVGQLIRIDSSDVQVLGVLPDEALQLYPAFPCVFRYGAVLDSSATGRWLAMQVRPGSEQAVMAASQAIWRKNVTQKLPNVFAYKSRVEADSNPDSVYAIFGFFCGLVMVVACLGILGMAAYAVDLRTKEIGVRRTLGANSTSLVWTLSRSFGTLLIWAGVFGVPAGWFCGSLLRQRMGNQVDLGPANLILGFGLVLLVGLLTVLSQTLRAARINPADVLRGE